MKKLTLCLLACALAFGGLQAQEEVPEKKEGMAFLPIPFVAGNSDIGFGFGLLLIGTYSHSDYTPYQFRVLGQLFHTGLGYDDHFVELDFVRFLGSPFRFKSKIGYSRNLVAQYYGTGNVKDLPRQSRITSGETAVNENLPFTEDLFQLNDEITLNRNVVDNPSGNLLNPSRRYLRETQNRYFNYDSTEPYLNLSLEDWFGDTNFKWVAGVNATRYKIQSYYNDYEGGNTFPNRKTLIDLEQPTGYDALDGPRMVNLAKFSLVYDSRPRAREGNPNSGILAGFDYENSGKGTGSDYGFYRGKAYFKQYLEILPDAFAPARELVFAYRLEARRNYGDMPFFSSEALGGSKTIRGYSSNQFSDRAGAMVNTELRYTFAKTAGMDFILMGYFDAGRVAPSFREIDSRGWHKAGGGGIRFVVQKNTVINISTGRSKHGSNLSIALGHMF